MHNIRKKCEIKITEECAHLIRKYAHIKNLSKSEVMDGIIKAALEKFYHSNNEIKNYPNEKVKFYYNKLRNDNPHKNKNYRIVNASVRINKETEYKIDNFRIYFAEFLGCDVSKKITISILLHIEIDPDNPWPNK